MINYVELKTAMTTAGYVMSAGAGWTAGDNAHYQQYLYFKQNGLPPVPGTYGEQYTGLLTDKNPAFPGAGGAVDTRKIVSFTVTGPSELLVGVPTNFTATALFDDGSTGDATTHPDMLWVASSPSVLEIVSKGVVKGLKTSESTILDPYVPGGDPIGDDLYPDNGTTFLSVVPASPVVSVALTGSNEIEVNARLYFAAIATLQDSSTIDVTPLMNTWVSSDPTKVLVQDTSTIGDYNGMAAGSAQITAKYWTTEITTPAVTVDCVPSTITSIILAGADEFSTTPLVVGGTVQLTALTNYVDTTSADTTNIVTWISSDPENVTVVNGLVTAVAPTSYAIITATERGHASGNGFAFSVAAA